MVEKWKEALDQSGLDGVLLMDLYEDLGCT